jgi:hypothetical protein
MNEGLSSGFFPSMFGDPAGADGAYVDAAARARLGKHTAKQVRADSGQRDDDENVCHVEIPGCRQYADEAGRVQAEPCENLYKVAPCL